MKYNKYNDNELLYLISQKDDDALESLVRKYHPLIENRLKRFNIKSCNHDDFYQECLMALYNAIKKFRDDKNGIFNLYLDNAIQNAIKRIINKEKGFFYNVSLVDDLEYISDENNNLHIYEIKEPIYGMFSNFEKVVYKKFYEENLSAKTISNLMICEEKKIYNALGRIKTKLLKNDYLKDERDNLEIRDINLDKLSGLEFRVFKLYVKGYKTIDIAYELGISFVQVSNALSRAKKKMK